MVRRLASAALALAVIAGGTGYVAGQQLAAAPGGTDVLVTGIEDTIQRLNGMRDRRDAAQAALILQILRGAGQQLPPEAGRSRLAYHVEVTQDGRIIINNVDVSMLIQMANQGKRS